MQDLRNHLFETLERLKDPEPENPMDIQTAGAIVDISKTLIDTARVENEYLALQLKQNTGGVPSAEQKQLGGWIGSSGKMIEKEG